MLDARVEDCMWTHCIYSGICAIVGNSLSFMLTVVDKILCRLFVRGAWQDYTYAPKIYVSVILNLL